MTKEPIRAYQVTVGMTVGMHGKPQTITHLDFADKGRIRLTSHTDQMYCNKSTTLTRYLGG